MSAHNLIEEEEEEEEELAIGTVIFTAGDAKVKSWIAFKLNTQRE